MSTHYKNFDSDEIDDDFEEVWDYVSRDDYDVLCEIWIEIIM